jgi:TRAP-type C4-dicarboxylate transport system permease small subunit
MQASSSIGIVFIAIAVIFVVIAFRDFLNAEEKMTAARKIWLRMAFIFAGVAIALFFVQQIFY